jgi:anti-sigma regulatory factor (Ser/Thr protein kinase)
MEAQSGDPRAAIRLELGSTPTAATLIRRLVGSAAEALELGRRFTDDLKTAISEAVNNVVLHAYGRKAGALKFSMSVYDEFIHVVVSDDGCGIAEFPPPSRGLGLGLRLMATLADHVDLDSIPGCGTTVRMSFALDGPINLSAIERLRVALWQPSLAADVVTFGGRVPREAVYAL